MAKLVSRDFPHKTEMGAIRVGLTDATALAAAISEMVDTIGERLASAHLDAILVQEMPMGIGEALIGLSQIPLAGLVITVASGGTLTEVYWDTAVRPAPASPETTWEMIEDIRGFARMRGHRGAPRGDLVALARAISSVSLLSTCAEVTEAEIDPVLIGPERKCVVHLDALIRKRSCGRSSPTTRPQAL